MINLNFYSLCQLDLMNCKWRPICG